MTRRLQRAIVVFAFTIGSATTGLGTAEAQDTPPTPSGRQGFVIGFSTGLGTASCRQCETRVGLDLGFRVGWVATPRLVLLLDAVSVGVSGRRDASLSQGLGTVAVQCFVSDSAWVKAGVGEAFLSNYPDVESFGWQVAAGAEIRKRGRYALDVSAGFATGRHSGLPINNLSLRLGFNWY